MASTIGEYDHADSLWFDTPISTLPYNTVLRFSFDFP